MLYALILVILLSSLSCERRENASFEPAKVKELVGIKGCPYCHDMSRKLLGPSFTDISRRYSEDELDILVNSILKGSRGKWGKEGMPPQKVTKEEAELIARWIISLKHELD
ncbi:c-type cytochrome [Hydrogenivirga sp. 128-5-R1-1]|uniref:c-type cytochrome n=1 Tax=Hydrogenivirga sp. 128-5-R1-1 TaxID=392423 RepID=UPI00015F15A5|nr:c-type cytochrome [Hydrogenivirga sp. 128-5-R1-1]EDP74733.1 cytochrome c, class I [Hydrogenivirga sp. 128-5-R1-1]